MCDVISNGIRVSLEVALDYDLPIENPHEVIRSLESRVTFLQDEADNIQENSDIESDKVTQVRDILTGFNESHDKATDSAVEALVQDIVNGQFSDNKGNWDTIDLHDQLHEVISEALIRYFDDIETGIGGK